VLFVDARSLGSLVTRTHKELSNEEIQRIAGTYHAWRGSRSSSGSDPTGLTPGVPAYADVPGFCKSATLEEIRAHGHVLTPGRYVGAPPGEDDGEPFEQKLERLKRELGNNSPSRRGSRT
jgi:type I restriction enzyme M protein